MADAASAGDLRLMVQNILLDKVRNDRYPSVTMMNMIEQGMTDGVREQYVQVLMDKVADDQFPSIPMIRRVLSLL